MKKREGEIAEGERLGICFDKVRFKDLSDFLLRDYRINGKKKLSEVENSIKALSDFLCAPVAQVDRARDS
jgi:hypothetical protein